MSNKIAGVVTKIVGALEALESPEERQCAVRAALTVFGDSTNGPVPTAAPSQTDQATDASEVSAEGIHSAGRAWMKRNGLTSEDLEQLFHFDDEGVSLLSAIGQGKRQQAINTYLLTGAGALLKAGKAEFDDETVRANCENLGCYDINNHGKTLKAFGNHLTGSKKSGWKLTAPGLSAAAALVKARQSQEAK